MAVAYDILKAVKKLIEKIDGVSHYTVRIRRKPAYVPSVDTMKRVICVCPQDERLADMTFSNTDYFDYPVLVAVVQENALLLEDQCAIEKWLQLREDIRRTLRVTTLATVGTVFDVTGYNPSPPFDPSGVTQGFDVSSQEFLYRSKEIRQMVG